MILWIDAQLAPHLAAWINQRFAVEANVDAKAVRDLGLRDAADIDIFTAACAAGAVVMTKDRDFYDLVTRLGSPPQVLWITYGNTSNARMKAILERTLADALRLLGTGESVVEIGDVP
jgi:predicted nuclease of predicted toxin-antitoxin system